MAQTIRYLVSLGLSLPVASCHSAVDALRSIDLGDAAEPDNGFDGATLACSNLFTGNTLAIHDHRAGAHACRPLRTMTVLHVSGSISED